MFTGCRSARVKSATIELESSSIPQPFWNSWTAFCSWNGPARAGCSLRISFTGLLQTPPVFTGAQVLDVCVGKESRDRFFSTAVSPIVPTGIRFQAPPSLDHGTELLAHRQPLRLCEGQPSDG